MGIDFDHNPNDLIIIDEADSLMFQNPDKFASFIQDSYCICFTATPDNCERDGVERKVVEAMRFIKYNYILN